MSSIIGVSQGARSQESYAVFVSPTVLSRPFPSPFSVLVLLSCLVLSCNDNQQTSSWSVVADGWAHGRRLRWLDIKPIQPDFKGLWHGCLHYWGREVFEFGCECPFSTEFMAVICASSIVRRDEMDVSGGHCHITPKYLTLSTPCSTWLHRE